MNIDLKQSEYNRLENHYKNSPNITDRSGTAIIFHAIYNYSFNRDYIVLNDLLDLEVDLNQYYVNGFNEKFTPIYFYIYNGYDNISIPKRILTFKKFFKDGINLNLPFH